MMRWLALVALVACTPAPAPAPAAPSCEAMCSHLDHIGCADGEHIDCVEACVHVVSSRLTKLDLPCLTAAANIEAARRCGGVRCADAR